MKKIKTREMMKKKFLFISNGFGSSTIVSGGEIRLGYLAEYSRKKYNVFLLTTTGGGKYFRPKKAFKNIIAVNPVSARGKKSEETKGTRFLEYIRTVKRIAKKDITIRIKDIGPDFIYTSGDFFCDVLPAVRIKKVFKGKWAAMVHMLYSSPFKRPGNFMINSIMYLLQRLSFIIIARNADAVCVLDNLEGRQIAACINRRKNNKKNNVVYVKNGIFLEEIRKTKAGPRNNKQIVLFGSNRHTKGLIDIARITALINKNVKGAKIMIYGSVTGSFRKELEREIAAEGIKNIFFTGYLDGKKRFKLMKESGLFFSLSREESWNISLHEALACGCRVVAYGLPVYHFYKDFIVRVEMFDKKDFADKAVHLLRAKYRKIKGIDKYLAQYDWEKILDSELERIEKTIKSRKYL
ncbi:MAG: glycosyltransferase family 4 protein [bacterium]